MDKNICKSYNGLMNEVCDAGFKYSSFNEGDDFGLIKKIPCFRKNNKSCKKKTYPTNEEIEKHSKEVKAIMEGTLEALAVIQKKTKAEPDFDITIGDKEGCSGVIDCPVCGSTLNYRVMAGNNHIWGKCSKEKCLSWMM